MAHKFQRPDARARTRTIWATDDGASVSFSWWYGGVKRRYRLNDRGLGHAIVRMLTSLGHTVRLSRQHEAASEPIPAREGAAFASERATMPPTDGAVRRD